MKLVAFTVLFLSIGFQVNLQASEEIEVKNHSCLREIKAAGENFVLKHMDSVPVSKHTSVYASNQKSLEDGIFLVETINHNATRLRSPYVKVEDESQCLIAVKESEFSQVKTKPVIDKFGSEALEKAWSLHNNSVSQEFCQLNKGPADHMKYYRVNSKSGMVVVNCMVEGTNAISFVYTAIEDSGYGMDVGSIVGLTYKNIIRGIGASNRFSNLVVQSSKDSILLQSTKKARGLGDCGIYSETVLSAENHYSPKTKLITKRDCSDVGTPTADGRKWEVIFSQ